jgi:arylsulfatase A-like enzyme
MAAWIIVAHVLGAAAIGALDSARLGSAGIAAAAVPMFAVTGLLVALISISIERALGIGRAPREGRTDRPWWLVALALSVPTLIVYVPVSASLFEGAYAQTLPLARAMPIVLPLVLWLATALAIAGGRRLLAGGDLASRAIVVLVLGATIGTLIWIEKNVLQTGYPTAHVGATVAVSIMAGLAIRVTRRDPIPTLVGYVVAGVVVLAAVLAALLGLGDSRDRQTLATYGDQTRDLVGLWRSVFDFDSDGTSSILGGGDCDDFDSYRHPGAIDLPGDGIDQDCDGVDAVVVAVDKGPRAEDAAHFRERADVKELLARTRGMNVLLVSVDALRADLIALGAPDRGDFPVITQLLADSVWFTHAFAPGTGTDISLSTLLTGRFDPFQPVATTLPEALRAAGHTTHAVIPGEVLRYAGDVMLHRGMDKLVKLRTDKGQADVGDHISAPETTTAGLRAIDAAGDKPWFVWTHYFDVHESHQIRVPGSLLAKVHRGASKREHTYRALLRAIDDELGRLLGELATRGLAERTIVVFASDHGESLGEDPRLLVTHGKVAYAALARIPLAFRVPGLAPGRRADLVSLVDLSPTLFSLLGIIPDDMPLDGTSLVPSLLDAPPALRPTGRALAINEQDQWSVVEWPYQLLVRSADDLVELYDLDADPLQRTDLARKHPDVVSRLKARYAAFPRVVIDRTTKGRSAREDLARQRPSREPR